MKTHSIAAATSGISFNGGARSARAALAGRTPCGPLGKRVRAMLRLACRVLGLKRRKGLGPVSYTHLDVYKRQRLNSRRAP